MEYVYTTIILYRARQQNRQILCTTNYNLTLIQDPKSWEKKIRTLSEVKQNMEDVTRGFSYETMVSFNNFFFGEFIWTSSSIIYIKMLQNRHIFQITNHNLTLIQDPKWMLEKNKTRRLNEHKLNMSRNHIVKMALYGFNAREKGRRDRGG